MATAAPIASLQTLRQEISTIEAEIKTLTDKREAEEKTLATFTTQRAQINEAIALGKEKPETAAVLNRKIEGSTAALQGFDSLLREPTKTLQEKYGELRRLEVETARAAEIDEVTTLQREGETCLIHIGSGIEQAVGNDLRAYLAVRQQLNRICGRAQMGVFPIPAAAQAANTASKHLDKVLSEKLGQVLKLFGR